MICEKNEKYSVDEVSDYTCEDDPAAEALRFEGEDPADEFGGYDEYEEYDDLTPDTVISDSADEDGLCADEYGEYEETAVRYALDGIIYEVAEELYFREKEAAERSVEEPPFHRVFDEQSIERLNDEYYERRYGKKRRRRNGELTTARAFLLELMLMIPVINVITAAVLSFREQRTGSIKACARAYTIWSALITAAAASCAVFFIAAADLPFIK